jgi:hypothetical protein
MAAVACMAGLLCVSATAQPGGGQGGGPGGFGLSPEAAAKAWEIQAAGVAKSLSLNPELSKKLLDAYKASRESLTKAAMAAFSSGGQTPGRGEEFRKMVTDERAKLETALKGFLTPEQTTTAIATLGTYDIRWDGMVNSIDGLGLDEKVKTDALNAVASYVVESGKMREAAAGDRDVIRTKGNELRSKLEAELAKILPAEQLTKLKELPGFRRGGSRPGGDRERGLQIPNGAAPGAAAPAPAPSTPPADAKK